MSTFAVTAMRVEDWDAGHPRWDELMQLVESVGQRDWVCFSAEFHHSSHMLVALLDEEIGGFLRYVVQEIGPDMGGPSVKFDGELLLEAKVIAFAVREERQRLGLGRALQQELVRRATGQRCYQVRSHSSGSNQANHQLKLSLGFAIHPIVRGEDSAGAYFILPLRYVS